MPQQEGWEAGFRPDYTDISQDYKARLRETVDPDIRAVSSVLEFIERFPQPVYEEKLSKIDSVLADLGCKSKTARRRLSEFLFADLVIGQPFIDLSVL